MNRAKQLVIATACGFRQDHELVKDALSDSKTAGQILEPMKITKADLFSLAGNGKSFFDYKETWENLGKLAGLMRRDGDPLTGADFLKPPAGGGRSALECAIAQNLLPKLFIADIWIGQMREMEDAWFSVPVAKRDGKFDFQQARRSVARAEGLELREDSLARMGVNVEELRKALAKGDLSKVKEKLAHHGDHLRKEDIFILDSVADYMMDSPNSWENFGEIHAELVRNGERLEVEDYLRKCADRKSLLEFAVGFGKSKEIFNAAIWRGRSHEMMALYDKVPEEKRKFVSIEPVLEQIAVQDFESRFQAAAGLTRQDLCAAVNESDRDLAAFRPMLALGQKVVWDKIGEVREILRHKGQSITQSDLRQVSGYDGECCQMLAARYGKFAQVLDILKENGETFSAADLLAPGKRGNTILDVLAEQKQIGLVLRPEQWAGRRNDMIRVWKAVPEIARKEIDFQALLGRVDVLSLRQRFDRPGGSTAASPAP